MIVVTGGAGFIGSNLVAELEDQGFRNIVVCDILDDIEKLKNIAKRDLRDLLHPDQLFEYLEEHNDAIEAIFHMGAISSTTEQNVDLINQINFILPCKLWEWCAQNCVRFIYASSAATYGDGSQGFKDDEDLEELNKLHPLNAYGRSKHKFDCMVASTVHDNNVAKPPQWAGLKFFNVYGPNEYHKGGQKSVVCSLYEKVIAGRAAELFKSHNKEYKDGGQLRDFVYVGDCVDVMLWLYDNPNVNGIYNVGTGKARSFNDLALSVFKAAEIVPNITYIDTPILIRDKYQYFTEADMKKLKEAGYSKAFTDLEDGVQTYIEKFLGSKDPYR